MKNYLRDHCCATVFSLHECLWNVHPIRKHVLLYDINAITLVIKAQVQYLADDFLQSDLKRHPAVTENRTRIDRLQGGDHNYCTTNTHNYRYN